MAFRHYLDRLFKKPAKAKAGRGQAQKRRYQPRVEHLEDRTMPAVSILNGGGLGYLGNGGGNPPDVTGMAGPNSYIEVSNSTIAIFNKASGTPVTPADSSQDFFFNIGKETQIDPGSQEISDTTGVFDNLMGTDGRFIIGDIDVDNTTNVSQYVFAVSTSSNPTSLTDPKQWSFYHITTTEGTSGSTSWSDYPGNPGFNADAFVETFNMFGKGPNGTQVVSINASDLANGVAQSSLHFYRNDVPGGARNYRPTTMHDAVTGTNPANDPMWLIRNPGDGKNIQVVKMTNVLTSFASFDGSSSSPGTELSLPTRYNFTSTRVSPLNPDGIGMFDVGSRILKAGEYNNTIVAAHAVELNTDINHTLQSAQPYDNNGKPTGGSGYSVGDTLTVVGGTSTTAATLTVTAVDTKGRITAVTVANAGSYSSLSGINGSVSTVGNGTGATLSLFFTGELAVQWYAIDVSGATPAFQQVGGSPNVGRIALGPNTYSVEPAIDINSSGQIGLGFMESDQVGGAIDSATKGDISTFVTARQPTDLAGFMETPVLVPAGKGAGDIGGRIGDFSGMNVDPVNGTFWHVNEFGVKGGGASTDIANFAPALGLGSTDESITIRVNPLDSTQIQVLVTGSTNVVTTFANNSPVLFAVQGDANSNAVTIDESFGIVNTPIRFDGGTGTNTLTIDDHNSGSGSDTILSKTGTDYTVNLEGVPISYDGTIQNVNVDTGTAPSTVRVYDTQAGTITSLATNGATTINVGADRHSLAGLNGELDVGTVSSTLPSLIVDDSGDMTGRTVTVNSDFSQGNFVQFNGQPKITFDPHGTSSLDVDGGPMGNTFNVTGSLGYSTSPTTLNTGMGVDTVNVHATSSGPLTVNGQSGHDQVFLGDATYGVSQLFGNVSLSDRGVGAFEDVDVKDAVDTVIHTATITNQSISNLAPGTISYFAADLNWLNIEAGSGPRPFTGSTFNFQSTPNHGPAGTVETSITSLGFDTVQIGNAGSLSGIQGDLSIYNNGYGTYVKIDDSADTGPGHTVAVSPVAVSGLAPATISFEQSYITGLEIDGGQHKKGSASTWNISNTPNSVSGIPNVTPTSLILKDTDTVNVAATTGSLEIDGNGHNNTVMLGSNHTMQNFLGDVTLTNQGTSNNYGRTTLTVDDSADTAQHNNVVLTKSSVAGLTSGAINLTLPGSPVTVLGGSNTNTFTVQSTTGVTTLTLGNGNNTIYVQGDSDPVNVHCGSLINNVIVGSAANSLDPIGRVVEVDASNPLNSTLTINDQGTAGGQNYKLAAPYFYRSGFGLVRYSNLHSVTVNGAAGGNQFRVQSYPPNTTLNTGAGDDTVTLSDANNRLDGLVGGIAIYGQGGKNTMNVTDSGATTGRTISLTGGAPWVLWGGGSASPYLGFQTLKVRGGAFGNTFNVNGTEATTTLYTGTGNNTTNVFGNDGSVTIVGQGPSNAVTVGGGYLGFVNGNVNVTGPAKVLIDDSVDHFDKTVLFGLTSVSGFSPGTVFYGGSSGTTSLLVKGGNGTNHYNVGFTRIPTELDTGAGADTVNVGSNNRLDSIVGALNVQAPGTGAALNINDQQALASESYLMAATGVQRLGTAPITYGVPGGTATLNAGARGNLFQMSGSPLSASFVVNMGAGTDTAQVAGTNVPTTFKTGGGNDIVTLGTPDGRLDNLQATTAVIGQGGNVTLNYTDQGDNAGPSWYYVVNDSTLARPGVATTTYAGISAVNVFTAQALNYYSVPNVESTAAGTTYTVTAGAGENEFFVGSAASTLNDIRGPVFLHGSGSGPDNDNILFFLDNANSADENFLLTAGTTSQSGLVQRSNPLTQTADMASVSFDGINGYDILETGSGVDAVNVRSEASTLSTGVLVGNGNDTITIGSLAPALGGTMANIVGDVSILSSTGQTPHITLDDSGNTSAGPRTVTLGSYPNLGYAIGGLGNSSTGRGLVFLSVDPATPVSILTGTPDDTFHIQDLVGAPAITINGGGGTNTLDYSAYTGDVRVDLRLGVAQGLAGISKIQNVVGSNGNNLLIGDANANVLTGGTGRNIMIGGDGLDTITGGGGDNLLIAGSTIYDGTSAGLADLELVMAEWLQSTDFLTRMAAIQHGMDLLTGTGIQLDTGVNIIEDGLANVINPGPGQNWIIP